MDYSVYDNDSNSGKMSIRLTPNKNVLFTVSIPNLEPGLRSQTRQLMTTMVCGTLS